MTSNTTDTGGVIVVADMNVAPTDPLPIAIRDACLQAMHLLDHPSASSMTGSSDGDGDNSCHDELNDTDPRVVLEMVYTWTLENYKKTNAASSSSSLTTSASGGGGGATASHNNNDHNKTSSSSSSWTSYHSPGQRLALALLYTRLADAFRKRRQSENVKKNKDEVPQKKEAAKQTAKQQQQQKPAVMVAMAAASSTQPSNAAAPSVAETTSNASSDAAAPQPATTTKEPTPTTTKESTPVAPKPAATLTTTTTTTTTPSPFSPSFKKSNKLPSMPIPQKLDLSPNVMRATQNICNDLLAVHELLGQMHVNQNQNYSFNNDINNRSNLGAKATAVAAAANNKALIQTWQDWSVVDIFSACYRQCTASHTGQRTAANIAQDTLVRTCLAFDVASTSNTNASTSDSSSNNDNNKPSGAILGAMFLIFTARMTQHAHQRLVQACWSRVDAQHLWDVLRQRRQEQRRRLQQQQQHSASSDNVEAYACWDASFLAAPWQPRVPGLTENDNDMDDGAVKEQAPEDIMPPLPRPDTAVDHAQRTLAITSKAANFMHVLTTYIPAASGASEKKQAPALGQSSGKAATAGATTTSANKSGNTTDAPKSINMGWTEVAHLEAAAAASTGSSNENNVTTQPTIAAPAARPVTSSSNTGKPAAAATAVKTAPKTNVAPKGASGAIHSSSAASASSSAYFATGQDTERRRRLLWSCAAMAFVLGLAMLTSPKNTETASKDPKKQPAEENMAGDQKRRKLEDGTVEKQPGETPIKIEVNKPDAIDVLLQVANEQAALTRWACLGKHKVEYDFTRSEILGKMKLMAGTLLTWGRALPMGTLSPAPASSPTAEVAGLPEWVQEAVRDILPKDRTSEFVHAAKDLAWNLPKLLEHAEEKRLHLLFKDKARVEAAPVIDETKIWGDEDRQAPPRMETLCHTVMDRPMDAFRDDSRASVVIMTSTIPGTAAVEIQKQLSKARRVLMHKQLAPPHSAAQALRRSANPTIITEAMEVNEWAVSVLYMDPVLPSKKLVSMLDASFNAVEQTSKVPVPSSWVEVIIPLINKALLLLSQEGLTDKLTRKAPVTVTGDGSPGQVQATGELTHDKALCRAVVAFYYHSLEAILYCESQRLGKPGHPKIVFHEGFHRALLTCCTSCVVKAIGATHKLRPSPNFLGLQIYSMLHICDGHPYDFLKVAPSFLAALTKETARGKLASPIIFELPRALRREISFAEKSILDSLLWARDPKFEEPFLDRIDDLIERTVKGRDGVCWWPVEVLEANLPQEIEDYGVQRVRKYPQPGADDYIEYKTASVMIRRILERGYERIQSICAELGIPRFASVVEHAFVAFRFLLRNRIDVFGDRHVDHWILSSIYGVAKQLKYEPEIKFASIIKAYVAVRGIEIGDVTAQRVVRHIKIFSADFEPSKLGNIIMLYNKVFVPIMKEHLLKSKAIKRSAASLAGKELMDVDMDIDSNVANASASKPNVLIQMEEIDVYMKKKEERLGNLGSETHAILLIGDPTSRIRDPSHLMKI